MHGLVFFSGLEAVCMLSLEDLEWFLILERKFGKVINYKLYKFIEFVPKEGVLQLLQKLVPSTSHTEKRKKLSK